MMAATACQRWRLQPLAVVAKVALTADENGAVAVLLLSTFA